MRQVKISKSDFDFFNQHARSPFNGFDVSIDGDSVILSYAESTGDNSWKPFEQAYDDAYVEHAPGPSYDPDAVGLRLEKISDSMVYQTYND